MSGDLTGKFNYSSLIRTLKDNGVQAVTLAAKRVGRDNDIENIKELDKSQEITIAQSIFNNAYTIDATNPFEAQNTDAAFPLDNSYLEKLNAGKIMSDGDSVMKLPEIYNDDEYEVADYDDYYTFGQNDETKGVSIPENQQMSDKTDYANYKTLPHIIGEESENEYHALPYTTGIEGNYSEQLLNNDFNKDVTDYMDDAEMASGLYKAPISQKKDAETLNVATSENEDVINEDALDMDMQNDSFSTK